MTKFVTPAKTLALFLTSTLAAGTTAATAQDYSDWEFALIGQTCHVYTNAAARDTSGSLDFTFGPNGFNAGFTYIYRPWPGEENEPPWDEQNDYVRIDIDNEEIWLGEEMFFGANANSYTADLTSGFVGEMLAAVSTAQQTVDFMVYRAEFDEAWLYGRFSVAGFNDTLAKAVEVCAFDPSRLPES